MDHGDSTDKDTGEGIGVMMIDYMRKYSYTCFMSSRTFSFRMAQKIPHLTDEAISLVARRFAVLAEPMRLRLLKALMTGEKPVNALVEATAGTQANVSRHLQTLADAGIVGRRKEGLQVFYSIADPSIVDLCELMCRTMEEQSARRATFFKPRRAGSA